MKRSLYNPKLGLKYLRLSAKNGDPDGLVSLSGDIYFDGDLVRESDKKALEYYQGRGRPRHGCCLPTYRQNV